MDLKFPLRFTDKSGSLCPSQHEVDCRGCIEKTEDVTFKHCEDVKEVTIHGVKLKHEGRLLKVKVELENVCPGRKVAVGVLLYKKECLGKELKGFKTCEIEIPCSLTPCHNRIKIGEFCFILAEQDLCSKNKLQLKVIAHYSSFPHFS